jgi:glycosyltransferase involved in cell wall biosynthesis
MRIAHVTDVYLPRLGGIELQVHDLVTRQRAAGHAAVVLTTTAGPDLPGVVRIGGTFGAGPYRAVPGRMLADIVHGFGADVVHAHMSVLSPTAWTAAGLATGDGPPTVVSVHSMWHDVLPLVRRYARLRSAAAWPVRWAAVSHAAAGAVSEVLDGTAVSVLPNGIDPAQWLLPTRPARDGVPTVVSVMRMVRRKRPAALLRALRALHATHAGRFRAVLVGDGPLLPGLRRVVASARLDDHVRLTGALDRTAIRHVLAAADLYVAPAPRESFGIAALEARSAGLPVLARAGSGVTDFVRHGVEGWLVDSDTGLHRTIGGLLDDPGRLAAVARHNRSVAPSVHWPTVLAAADALYAAAVRDRGIGDARRLLGSTA